MNSLTWSKVLVFALVLLLVVPASGQAQTPNVSFWADSARVPAGQCTVLHWQADAGAGIFHLVSPDGKDSQVAAQGQVSFCPPQPQTYRFTFKVLLPDGREVWYVQPITANPQPVCTPPPCAPPNQLKCPPGQTCPGGCGVQCVPPARSGVTWKVAGVVYDSIAGLPLGGASVTCQGGGQQAAAQTLPDGRFSLTWGGNTGGELACTFQAGGFGSQTLKPALPPQPKAPTTKGVTQDYGEVQAILVPNYRQGDGAWAINYVAQRVKGQVGEPVGPMQQLSICSRKFQNDQGDWNYMFWRSGDKQQAITALVGGANRTYYTFDDTWNQNATTPCAPPAPGSGWYLPDKGLGWVWCTQSLQQVLGYSIEPQETCADPSVARWQDFQQATLVWLHHLNWVVLLDRGTPAWSLYDFSPRQPGG